MGVEAPAVARRAGPGRRAARQARVTRLSRRCRKLPNLARASIVNGATSTYGADPSGLICGFLIDPAAGGRAIESHEAATWLGARATTVARPTDAAFLWLHFNLAHTGALPWLTRHAGLSGAFFEMLNDGLHSTRVERTEEELIAVINDVHFDFAFEPSEISTLWINVQRQLVITARSKPLRSVDKLREQIKGGQRLRSSAELLEHLLRAQADVLVDIVRGVTDRVDRIEDELLLNRLDHKRAGLGALRRLLVRLQRLLAPEPAALFRLLQHPPAWMAALDAQELRQSSEEFSVVLRDMTTLQERIKLLQEEIAAQVNEDNNRSLFVLTIVTVLALPINIIAGLLGMNVGGVPLAQHAHGFWIVVLIVLSFTVIAGWIVFRRQREH
jgi:zinc transporter